MVKRVSPREAQDLMKQGYVYVDVRSTPEFERGRPASSVLVPFAEAGPAGMVPNANFVGDVAAKYPKDAKLILGCEAGGRSARAAAALEQSGFTALVDQRAGFGGNNTEKGWRDEGLPVETGKAK